MNLLAVPVLYYLANRNDVGRIATLGNPTNQN